MKIKVNKSLGNKVPENKGKSPYENKGKQVPWQ